MNRLHHPRITGRILAGTIVMAVGLLSGATAAYAAVPCVLTPATGSAIQTDTTVTGGPENDTIDCSGASPGKTITGNGGNDTITGTAEADTISGGDGNDTITALAGDDTLDGGLGIDTISGSDGDDDLVGPSFDGSQDSLDGGIETDSCQRPAPDPDIHADCETTTDAPLGSPITGPPLAGPLCEASGGVYANVALLYTCVFPDVFADHRAEEADNICTQSGGTFADLPLNYSCVTLPAPPAGSRA